VIWECSSPTNILPININDTFMTAEIKTGDIIYVTTYCVTHYASER
jgi:hypothetical protein